MNDPVSKPPHWSFWIIGAIMLLWNVMGCINFFAQMNPEILASYRESERIIVEGRPGWATGGFALAVFAGALGCLLLLLRKFISFYLFIASLLGVIIATTHTLSLGVEFSAGELAGIVFMPLAVAIFLIWYAWFVKGKGWIA